MSQPPFFCFLTIILYTAPIFKVNECVIPMPYKDKSKTAEAMRKYRVRKNPTKNAIKQLTIIFSRAFVHAYNYPNLKNSNNLAFWVHQFQEPYYNPSVKASIKKLEFQLNVIDNLFWRHLYEGDMITENKSLPEEHRSLLIQEQNLLHELFQKLEKGTLEFKEILEGVDYPLPLDKLETEKNE